MTTVVSSLALPPHPRNVGRAREFVCTVLRRSGLDDLIEVSLLLVSELVTNAFVHTGTDVHLRVATQPGAVRVEVQDEGDQAPARRHYATTAGTGRGLQLVEELTARWGVETRALGKTVWFELGDPATGVPPHGDGERGNADDRGRSGAETGSVPVTLRQVPLLMHVAWQEHAATLLRELLLHALDHDDHIMTEHAQASAAMALLDQQIPVPLLSEDPDALMAEAIEPTVTEAELVLQVPLATVPCFVTLDDLLARAVAYARAGHLLCPPTQPEIEEMRQWLCREVAQQAAGDSTATPWLARTDVRATLADQAELAARFVDLASEDEPLLATDEASIIVAASPKALTLLGYDSADQLVGRRVIVVVPARFHQAHIAGTTLHVTNGRSTLLGLPITVPMVRADGTEVPVSIVVRPVRLDDHRVFVARFHAA